jgi:DNA-binding SARP family transcriptional activator
LIRQALATLLWPDQPDRTARGSLSQALTTLRNALGDKTADRPMLLADAQTVQLDPDAAIEVDVKQFLARLTANEQARRDETMRACRATLGEAAFADARAKGRVLTSEQAINLALEPSARLFSVLRLATSPSRSAAASR